MPEPMAPTVVPYPPGRGLAVLFADEAEGARVTAQREDAARALAGFDFDVRAFGAERIMADTKSALAGFSGKSVLVWYTGHGGRSSSAPSEGYLCGHAGGAPVDVKTLLFEVSAAVPPGTPKLFILDCCNSDSSAAPPIWQVAADAPQPHDFAFLRSTSAGFYGYTVGGKGVTHFLAEALEDLPPGDTVDWSNISDLIAPQMKSFCGGTVEPSQTNLTSGRHCAWGAFLAQR